MFPSHQTGRCFTFVLPPPSRYSYLKLHNVAVNSICVKRNFNREAVAILKLVDRTVDMA